MLARNFFLKLKSIPENSLLYALNCFCFPYRFRSELIYVRIWLIIIELILREPYSHFVKLKFGMSSHRRSLITRTYSKFIIYFHLKLFFMKKSSVLRPPQSICSRWNFSSIHIHYIHAHTTLCIVRERRNVEHPICS